MLIHVNDPVCATPVVANWGTAFGTHYPSNEGARLRHDPIPVTYCSVGTKIRKANLSYMDEPFVKVLCLYHLASDKIKTKKIPGTDTFYREESSVARTKNPEERPPSINRHTVNNNETERWRMPVTTVYLDVGKMLPIEKSPSPGG